MYLVVQWHITEQCNWRCTHCYHEQYLEEGPSLKKLKEIFIEILGIKENFYGKIKSKRINFVGGEPLIRKDFIELLGYINSKVKNFDIGILTNGSLINDDFLNNIKEFDNLNFFFQISIEGGKNINDNIRGKGTFNLIKDKVVFLKNRGFKVSLSFTLTNKNKDEIFKLIGFIKKYNILFKIRRIVPMGQSKEEFDLMLSPKEWYKFTIKIASINFNILKNRKYGEITLDGCSEVTGYNYRGGGCGINTHKILTIMHDLNVFSCRRLPISIGNLKEQKLKNIFLSNEYKKQLNIESEIDICKKCPYLKKCKGGAKCITYSKKGTLLKEDPQCYFAELIKKELK